MEDHDKIRWWMPADTYTEEDAKRDLIFMFSGSLPLLLLRSADININFNADKFVCFTKAWSAFKEDCGNLSKSAATDSDFVSGMLSIINSLMRAVFDRSVSNSEILQFYQECAKANAWKALFSAAWPSIDIFSTLLGVEYGTEFSKGSIKCYIDYGGGVTGKVQNAGVVDILGQSVFYYCPTSKLAMMSAVKSNFPILLEYDKETAPGVWGIFHSCFAVAPGTSESQAKELTSEYIQRNIAFRPGVSKAWYIGDPEPAGSIDASVFNLK